MQSAARPRDAVQCNLREAAIKREETLRLGKSMNLGYGCAIPDSDPWVGATVACLNNYCMLQYTPPAKPPSLRLP